LGEITPNGSEREFRTLMLDERNYINIPVLNGLDDIKNVVSYALTYESEPIIHLVKQKQ